MLLCCYLLHGYFRQWPLTGMLMMNMCNDFPWETQFLLGHDKSGSLLLKDYSKDSSKVFHGFPPANESGLEGKWAGTGFSPQLSRQWPINLICADTGGGWVLCRLSSLWTTYLGSEALGGFPQGNQGPEKLCFKGQSCHRVSLPHRQWGTQCCCTHPFPLLLTSSYWLWLGWNLNSSSIGAETVRNQPEMLPADSTAAVEHGHELSALLAEIQLWGGSSWEIMSNQCDAVCATLQSANKTGEKFFK